MKTSKYSSLLFVFTFAIFFSNAVLAFSLFGNDEDIIWEGAVNNYFKYVEQDESNYGKNDHPIELDENDIINALTVLTYTDTTFLGGETVLPVFSYSQVHILAEYLSKGLSKAEPEQDIIYAISGSSKKLLILTKKSYTTGRVFYKEGKLNIIIGEYNFGRSEAMEKELDPSGSGDVNYNFRHGFRDKKSNNFKGSIIGIPGVVQKANKGKARPDWIEIDINVAAEAYLANKNKKENPGLNYDKALKSEAAKLAKQRREMRAEMARLRREVAKQSERSTPTRTIEERIKTLDGLLEKELISQDEYAVRRKEILNDI